MPRSRSVGQALGSGFEGERGSTGAPAAGDPAAGDSIPPAAREGGPHGAGAPSGAVGWGALHLAPSVGGSTVAACAA